MDIGKFIQSFWNTEVLGEETVKKQEEIFQEAKGLFPGHDPHFYLAQVWLSRVKAHGNNPNDPQLQTAAWTETFIFSCVPPPLCARALGLYLLYQERPDIIQYTAPP